jgi:hypothetical protein
MHSSNSLVSFIFDDAFVSTSVYDGALLGLCEDGVVDTGFIFSRRGGVGVEVWLQLERRNTERKMMKNIRIKIYIKNTYFSISSFTSLQGRGRQNSLPFAWIISDI